MVSGKTKIRRAHRLRFYEEAPTSPKQDTEGDKGRAEDGEAVIVKAKRLSPRLRLRRESLSLARVKKKQWGHEWILQLQRRRESAEGCERCFGSDVLI